MDGIGRKGERMSKRTFYIANALAWTISVLAVIEPVSNKFKEATPMQFLGLMCVVTFVMYLVLKSMLLFEEEA